MAKKDSKTNIELKEVNQPHDKIFRKILLDKNQTAGLLNYFFNFKTKLNGENIERYNCKFVNAQFKNKEADIIYKIKGTNTFFLIEHQSRVDYNMAQRIAEYQTEIIKIENPIISNSKDISIPLIIPLVIYASNNSIWNAHRNIIEAQPHIEGYNKLGIGGYDVLDINTLEKEELMNHSLFIYRVLSIEKSETTEELTTTLAYLLENEKDEENENFLKDIIRYIYKDTLKSEKIYKYFNEKNMKGVDNMGVIEMVLKEKNDLLAQGRLEGMERGLERGMQQGMQQGIQKGIKKGKKAGIKENTEKIIIEMLKQKIDDNIIIQITKIDSYILEKLKKKQK